MKKILFGTSAIAASLFTVNAYAAEWSIDVGGFHTVGMGVTNVEAGNLRGNATAISGTTNATNTTLSTALTEQQIGNLNGAGQGAIDTRNNRFNTALAASANGNGEVEFHLINDGEIHFDPKLVADNGLTFGAHIEMETTGDEGTIDESSVYVSGSFGKIEIGEQDGAYMAQGPKGCTAFTCAGDGGGLLFDRVGGVNGGFDSNGKNSGDDLKISYFTPTFSGFQAGVSFVPDGSIDGPSVNPRSTSNEYVVEFGAKYAQDFGGVGFSAGAGYTMTESGADDDSWGVGAAVSASGFTFGGSVGSDFAGEVSWSVGANYATGPWNFGVNYFNGSPQDSMGISAGADYTLAQGVKAGVTVEYAEATATSTVTSVGNNNTVVFSGTTEQTGWAAGTFLNLSF